MPERHDRRLVELFKEASRLTGSEQEAFIQKAREEDAALAASLEELLDQHPASLSERLTMQYGAEADPNISLDPAAESETADFASEVVERLAGRGEMYGRYKLKGEVARGGQGAILRVWDEDLRRNLAMKVVLGKGEERGDTPHVDSKTLGRFLEEAQVTGQLDHPGIVPVHELGLDDEGRTYFTMKLVKGEDLLSIFDKVDRGEEGWTQTRALNVLLKVCEAMAYAHSKGVIHRDLKPSNVMVGKFGEVYVMDWGLARVMGRDEEKNIRIRPAPTTSDVRSDRQDKAAETPYSPLITMDGDVVGTPAYMSPEQARGDLEAMGPHSDVYSLGAMLYHLLAGGPPYVPADSRLNNYAIWYQVQNGPPEPVQEKAPTTPAELVAICDKAMARPTEERYSDTGALAADLAAYAEGRVVRAYEAGAWAEARKWVRRNKPLAASLAAAVLALAVGLVTTSVLLAWARSSRDRVLRLSDLRNIDDLESSADELWPPLPERIPAYEAWLGRARDLVSNLPDHRATLDDLEGSSASMAWWISLQTELVQRLEDLRDPERGLISGIVPGHGLGIERRLEHARRVAWETIERPEARSDWREAAEAVSAHPDYDGVELRPQIGLAPLGADPRSGLWEFADVLTGKPPERDSDTGDLTFTDGSGLVFVLIPGGTHVELRRNRLDSSERRALAQLDQLDEDLAEEDLRRFLHDRGEQDLLVETDVAPFLLSKFEMTQAQWRRTAGWQPSHYDGDSGWGSPTSPVEMVSWHECSRELKRLGLRLPTVAEWELAAACGRSTWEAVWSHGDDVQELYLTANLADVSALDAGFAWESIYGEDGTPIVTHDDAHPVHAPVGSFRPSPWGLYDLHGNVWEWAADEHADLGNAEEEPLAIYRFYVGGGFFSRPDEAVIGYGMYTLPESKDDDLGVRPARSLIGVDDSF